LYVIFVLNFLTYLGKGIGTAVGVPVPDVIGIVPKDDEADEIPRGGDDFVVVPDDKRGTIELSPGIKGVSQMTGEELAKGNKNMSKYG
jgi:hypothetical protein